jgi:inner membrane protein creD
MDTRDNRQPPQGTQNPNMPPSPAPGAPNPPGGYPYGPNMPFGHPGPYPPGNGMPPRYPGQYPPPYGPYGQRPHIPRRKTFGEKIVLLALQAIVLMIAAAVVWGMVESRESTNDRVTDRIASEWGGKVKIDGPVANLVGDSVFTPLIPQGYTAEATVKSENLHRSIYECEVFKAHVRLSSRYCVDSVASPGDEILVTVDLNTAHISNLTPLTVGGKTYSWNVTESGINASIPFSELADAELNTEFDIRGSGSIEFKPLCTDSKIMVEGEATNPSFMGRVSPDRRDVWNRKFSASWDNAGARTPSWDEDDNGYIGTEFLVGVSRYQKVSRSIKYAFIIILLTYVTVIFTEITMRHPIPMFNYFLIGAALILFYCLLLALSEHLSFGWAYLVAMAMTVGLITIYMWRMLKSRKVGLVMGSILTVIYTSCYIMLCVSSYALLMGSLLLFCALAGLMYGSLRINTSSKGAAPGNPSGSL